MVGGNFNMSHHHHHHHSHHSQHDANAKSMGTSSNLQPERRDI